MTIDKAGELARKENCDFVVGLGGGGAAITTLTEADAQAIYQAWHGGHAQRAFQRFAALGRRTQKPLAAVIGPSDYSDERLWRLVSQARDTLVEAELAVFPSVERAVRTLARFAAYWERR